MSISVGITVVCLGLTSLIGWIFGISILTSFLPGLATMKVNTAICFLMLGFSLVVSQMGEESANKYIQYSRVGSAFVAIIGLLTLSEYLFGIDLGIDDFLTWKLLNSTVSSGRMAPATAINMLIMGAALCVLDVAAKAFQILMQAFCFFGSTVGILATIGHVYSAENLYESYLFSSVSLPTAISFGLLGLGILFDRPNRGLMTLLASPASGGVIVRRALPWATIVPFLLGWLQLYGQRRGFYGAEFGLMLFVVSVSLIFSLIVWRCGALIDQIDSERWQAKETFEAVVEGSPTAMIVADRQGHILLANKQAERSFLYPQFELLGRKIELLLPSRFRDQHVGHRELYVSKPERREMCVGRTLFGMRKDGSEFPVEVGLNPIQMRGEPVVLGTIVDITERMAIERKLRESEERLRQLANSMPQMVWIANADGTAEYFNDQWRAFTDISSPSVDFRNSVLHPDDLERANSVWRRSIVTGEPYQIEYRFWDKKNGCYRWYLGRANPIKNGDDQVIRWFGTCTDIHDLTLAHQRISEFNIELEQAVQNRTAELQKAVEALEVSNKELDSFCFSISHDLRAPLRGIEGFSRLLQEDFVAQMTPEVNDLLDRIKHNSKKMSSLIDDLLAFSRLSRSTLSKRRAESANLVSEVVKELRSTIGCWVQRNSFRFRG